MTIKSNTNVLNACEFCLQYLAKTKKTMIECKEHERENKWAIGSFVFILTSSLLQIMHETFTQPEHQSGYDDIRTIQAEFNNFIDQMLEKN